MPKIDRNLQLLIIEALIHARVLRWPKPPAASVRSRSQQLGKLLDTAAWGEASRVVKRLTWDGGNKIWDWIDPDWDGEGDGFDVSSLAGINRLVSLESLTFVAGDAVSDLSPLAQLPALRFVKLARTYPATAANLKVVADLKRSGVDAKISLQAKAGAKAAKSERAANKLYYAAQDLQGDGKFLQAERGWTRYLELVPDSDDAMHYRATCRRELGKLDLALADVQRALSIRTTYDALLERAQIRLLTEHFADALTDLTAALEYAGEESDIGWIHDQRGIASYQLGRKKDAEACYTQAIDAGYDSFANRGEVRFQAKRLAEALADLDHALADDPDDDFALVLRGKVHAAAGRAKEAARDYRKAGTPEAKAALRALT